jgi:hypothetical protein
MYVHPNMAVLRYICLLGGRVAFQFLPAYLVQEYFRFQQGIGQAALAVTLNGNDVVEWHGLLLVPPVHYDSIFGIQGVHLLDVRGG